MWEDPLVEEIRNRRREIMAEYDNDINKRIDDIKRERKKYSDRIVHTKKKRKVLVKGS
ncbi:MAG: hypothetical protein AAB116_07725 [Candidatus Poribacteria bacterium]